MFESWSSKFKLGAFLLATGIVIRTVLGLSTKEDEEIQKAKEIMKKARKERRRKRFYAFLAGTASLVAGYKCTSSFTNIVPKETNSTLYSAPFSSMGLLHGEKISA